MPSTDAATGKYVSVREHYDRLIDMGNDPVLDPPVLKEYMDGWDGEALMDALCLTPGCRVLEIGVGTGRLALRVLERGCAQFTGMDVSGKTIEAARKHLSGYPQAELVAGEFPFDLPGGRFDRIYSSLTFLHIEEKERACACIAALLDEGGRAVISLDKDQSGRIDMGSYMVRVRPDHPDEISAYLRQAGLRVYPVRELERAWLITADHA
ncbi:MAG: methyltransferase domain-containing protein [Clostridia bacterium]|nr:methyltransferase domain-containing protein [Clostridia bacterium]